MTVVSDLKGFAKRLPLAGPALRAARTAMLPHPRKIASASTRNTTRLNDPLVIAGMFSTASGLGEAARMSMKVLQDNGYAPTAIDLSGVFNQVDVAAPFTRSLMPKSDHGTLILHANAPETRPALKALGLRRWQNWRIIGYWAWEFSEPDPAWLDAARHLSEIWTPSQFVTDAFSRHVEIPVRTVPIRVRAPESVAVKAGDARGPMKCLAMADGRSSFHRKNITATARMFCQAFAPGDGAELTLKVRNANEFPQVRGALDAIVAERPDVTILDASISDADRWTLINAHDIMISAHRAEGYGLHLAEAMAAGKCAVATGWSGNMQFMSPDTAVLLPYALRPAQADPYGIYTPPLGSEWAEVDEAAGIDALRRLRDDPAERADIGARARSHILSHLDGSSLIAALHPSETAA